MIGEPTLPDGSIVNAQILITSYFNEHGEMMYTADVDGHVNIGQVLGLLVLGGITIYKHYQVTSQSEIEEDDDDGTDD